MSKGGAGKVYFVLYLAVILELLIIFIERDEAEENLRRQQQQAIQIVQTILSQLQTGSGATGITASPKDNIVLDPKDSKNDIRNYTVVVAVGDPKASSSHAGKTVKGDDVSRLEYIVSHLTDPGKPENELGPDSTDIEGGNKIFHAALGTDVNGYKSPTQLSGGSVPAQPDPGKGYFELDDELTAEQTAKGRRVKVFRVNFKPNNGPGWYRLRFYSETNKILGVTGEPKDDDTVRIGNIKLTVKQLRQVQKVMRKQRGADGSAGQVEKYIEQLLAPDAYKRLPENQGFTSFNVRVVRPDLPPPAVPFASIASPRDTIYWLSVADFSVQVSMGPKEARKDVIGASFALIDQQRNLYLATVQKPEPGVLKLTATASNGGATVNDDKFLSVEAPLLRAARIKDGVQVSSGVDGWRALTAVYGSVYDPSSEWANVAIPADHYQTIVTFRGAEVLNRQGFNQKNLSQDLQKALTVPDGMKPEEIVTKVYWKPGGTVDASKWVLLLCNQEGQGQVINLEKRKMRCVYRSPELIADKLDYLVQFNPKNKTWKSETFQAIQKIGNADNPVTVNVNCAECNQFGLNVTLNQISDKEYQLEMQAPSDLGKLLRLPEFKAGKPLNVEISLQGRGDPKQEGMTITVQVAPR